MCKHEEHHIVYCVWLCHLFADPSELGCSVDVITFLDKVCSGRTTCEYPVLSEELYATKPCSSSILSSASYLEVSFQCIQGERVYLYIVSSTMNMWL